MGRYVSLAITTSERERIKMDKAWWMVDLGGSIHLQHVAVSDATWIAHDDLNAFEQLSSVVQPSTA